MLHSKKRKRWSKPANQMRIAAVTSPLIAVALPCGSGGRAVDQTGYDE
jgi:hypothetical protein